MNFEDNLYKFLPTYLKIPTVFKKMMAAPFKLLPREFYWGKNYSRFLDEANSMDFASENDIREYQFLKLKNILAHAYNSVPYYRKVWNEHGIKIDQIQSFEDFSKKIPFLEREAILRSPEEFLSSEFHKKHYLKVRSRGTSGRPLSLYYLKGYCRAAEWAHMHMLWSRIGFKLGSKMARLKGDYIGSKKTNNFDPWRNCLILSSLKLNHNTADLYLNLIEKYKVEYINAFPSTIFNLVQLSDFSQREIPTLKGILLSSENIYPWQIKKLKDFFNINNIYYWYGQGEQCALGGGCEKSSAYHFLPSYSYIEFSPYDISYNDKKKEPVSEIIGTSFLNPLMPLIRYRTQDLCTASNNGCECGRHQKQARNILGRKWEFVVGRDGEKITLTALGFFRHFKYFDHIVKMQMINTAPGKLIIKIVPRASLKDEHVSHLKKTFSIEGGLPFVSEVKKVKQIETTERGKHKFFLRTFKLEENEHSPAESSL